MKVSEQAILTLLLGPSAITIHDDGNMLRYSVIVNLRF
jgi:hypothetical protein